MQSAELIRMLDNGLKPVIEFTDIIETDYEYDPNAGMQCECIGYYYMHGDNRCIWLKLDFKLWREYNEPFAKRNYYDKNGEPNLTWFESVYYPSNELYEMCVSIGDMPFIKLSGKRKHYEKYKESKSLLNYITWLELRLDESEAKCEELGEEVKTWKRECNVDENECAENCLCCYAYGGKDNCDLGYDTDFIYED